MSLSFLSKINLYINFKNKSISHIRLKINVIIQLQNKDRINTQ